MYLTTDWAWLAGIVDGEGSFNLLSSVAPRRNPQLRPTYKPSLQIGMCDTEAIIKAADMLDAPIYCYGKVHKGYKDEFRVSMQGRRLGAVLLRLLPWLKTKRQRAEMLLSFILNCPSRQGKLRSEEEQALQYGYHLAIKTANSL